YRGCRWPRPGSASRCRADASFAASRDGHRIAAVDLGQADVDAFAARRREVLAYVIGADRQIAVAAVDEDGEADPGGAADVGEGIESGPAGAAGAEHVVDEADCLRIDAGGGDPRGGGGTVGAAARIVTVHGDVEAAGEFARRLCPALDRGDSLGEPVGQGDSAARDAEEDEV